MNRNDVIARLKEHRSELQSVGVVGMSVFGSVARGDDRSDSDIDLAVILAPDFAPAGGFSYFGKLDELQGRLGAILGRPVDLIAEPVRRPLLQREIDGSRVRAF